MGTLLTLSGAEAGVVAPVALREYADVKPDGTRRELVNSLGAAGTPSVLGGGGSGVLALGVAGLDYLMPRMTRKFMSADMADALAAYGLTATTLGAVYTMRPKGSAPASSSSSTQAAQQGEAQGVEIQVGGSGSSGSSGSSSGSESASTTQSASQQSMGSQATPQQNSVV